jgi:hypothetical protein
VKLFDSSLYLLKGKMVILVDGLKNPKEGRKMPGVKSLHQESESNSKPTYIMGHYFECFSLLVGRCAHYFAVPLASRIHGGVLFSKAEENITLIDRLISFISSTFQRPFYMVADAYYAVKKLMIALKGQSHFLITRMRTNAVAWEYPPKDTEPKKRGRGRTYGYKILLRKLFLEPQLFKTITVPMYDEKKAIVDYLVINVLLRPFALKVRIVLVNHHARGKIILLSTDLSLSAVQIIRTYSLRYKIELSFKQGIHTLGTYAYHFWMKSMEKIKRCSSDQLVYVKNALYQSQVRRKLTAYENYVQMGLISQGLLIYLSLYQQSTVWKYFPSWFRTQNAEKFPSEWVVAASLRATFGEFLFNSTTRCIWKKFLVARILFDKKSFARIAA